MLFINHHNRVLLRYLEANDAEKVLSDVHDGPTRGHFVSEKKMHKVMHASVYWPTLFKYSHIYARKCSVYQKCVDCGKKSVTPLQPIIVE